MPSCTLILPYWDRQQAANEALKLLEVYADMDMEVIVVDDGNRVPFVAPQSPLNIRVIRRPLKDIPTSPAAAWNEGVREAKGDIIALSCVEILHKTPVLPQMLEQCRNMGEKSYILAAAFCPEDGSYHCHSTVKTPRNPVGTGISFLAVLHKSLYWEAGGFDEEYMLGAGYEDNDFINRLLVAGARFVIRDDLEVIHPKTGASIAWGAERFALNERLYYSKWPKELRNNSVTFCCVNAGNYLGRGNEYVDILFDMVMRNLPDGFTCKFVCFTDDKGENPLIEYRPLVEDLQGWDNKIALFKEGVFEDGERICYFDLDTLILGRIDQILGFQGDFAVLRDFWNHEQLGPAVMLWRGGWGSFIWDKFVEAGKPQLPLGDKQWLQTVLDSPSILQDLYPGVFCSFKGDCRPYPPANTRIVCFHGLPRPHEVSGWSADVWKIGGLTGSYLELACNVGKSRIVDNMKSACARDIPELEMQPVRDDRVALVGGGPSVLDDIEHIRNAGTIIAMNGSAAFLASHGIIPDIQILIDARPENIRFLGHAKSYYFASQCDPSLFDAVPATRFNIALLSVDYEPPGLALGGGHSVGLYAMSLAYALGFRKMDLYGYDSSYRESHHAYDQPSNDGDEVIDAIVHGRVFKTTQWMVMQVNEFQELSNLLALENCEIVTHGDGLLPFVAWQRMKMAA